MLCKIVSCVLNYHREVKFCEQIIVLLPIIMRSGAGFSFTFLSGIY